jgi:hypothetical protein
MSSIVDKILERIEHPELLDTLKKLSGTELNSILLEVFNQQIKDRTAPEMLKLYRLNRFVKPADLPVLALREVELHLLQIFKTDGFDPIELSPVSILGSCSVVAPADQKKILSALRGTEVLADATNAIALHISDLKQSNLWQPATPDAKLKFATIQRHVRTQAISGKGFTPHFKIGCLVTAGMDAGNFSFEKEAISQHVAIMKKIFEGYYKVERLSFRLMCRKGYADSSRLAGELKKDLELQHPEIDVVIVENPENEIEYYKGIQYKVDIAVKGKPYEIGDGGFTDWTQQLLQNKKERLLITGFGFELMYRIMNNLL